jgi:type 2A phosphatase activator TIP41
MPLSRRSIDIQLLSSFEATPIYSSTTSDGEERNRHKSAATQNDDSPIGIRISRWEITTRNSTIGNERDMESLTCLLEDVANNPSNDTPKNNTRRRLCPPEITFLNANISLKRNNTEIRFNATDALMEWAEAHRYLDHSFSNDGKKLYRGVQILQTKDAKAWSDKSINSGRTSEFYYDWTFATPFAGTLQFSNQHTSDNRKSNTTCINNRRSWRAQTQSSIPFHLLQDTSQPMLLYDDITLFEDDLHDNGEVSLNVKIRVTPSYWYVLQRLFVRVDHVCLKVREVRMYCYFGEDSLIALGVENHTVYRDLNWREATWDDLLKLGLSTDPARWRGDGENAAVVSQMMGRLPGKNLPSDLPRYSSLAIDVDGC